MINQPQPEEAQDIAQELLNLKKGNAEVAPEAKVEEAKVEPEVKVETKAEVKAEAEPEKKEVTAEKTDAPAENSEVDDYLATYLTEQFGEDSEPAASVEAKADVTKTDEPKAEAKEEAAAYEFSDLEKWIIESRQNGKDPIKELEVLFQQDPDKYSAEELFEKMLVSEGLTEDEIEIERDSFEAKTPLEKRNAVKAYKEKLKADRESKMELLKPQAVQDNSAEFIANAKQSLETLKTEKLGKSIDGMELTKERVDRIAQYVSDEAPFAAYKPDGNLDVEEMFAYAAWKMYGSQIKKSIAINVTNEVKKKFLQDRALPTGGRGGQQANVVRTASDALEDTIENFSNK